MATSAAPRQLPCEAYTVAWMTILAVEQVAAVCQLDEHHLPPQPLDTNFTYFGGSINGHNIVIARTGKAGPEKATECAEHIRNNFPNIEFGVLVGVAGGLPREPGHDIRLGDIVVSKPEKGHGGVAAYQGLKLETDGIKFLGHLNEPPRDVLNAVNNMETQLAIGAKGLQEAIDMMRTKRPSDVSRDGLEDTLYATDDGDSVKVQRSPRAASDCGPHVHYGLVASGPHVIKTSGQGRVDIMKRLEGIGGDALCFEMEACGVMNSFPFLVVRGICDYCDSHKHKDWQPYAAAMAACYAKWLMQVMQQSRRSKAAQHSALTPAVSTTPQKYKVPFSFGSTPPVPQFFGRHDELAELEKVLAPNGPHTERKIFVLSGFGGIGKTQLSLKFARQNKDTYSACIWVDGSSVETVKKSFRDFLRKISDSYGNQPQSEQDEDVQRVLDWLSLDDNRKWLLIFDNVDLKYDSSTPEPGAFDIEDYLPRADHGSILVTTRLRELESLGKHNNIEGLGLSEALQLLEARSGKSLDGDAAAEETIKKVDGFPLALTLAGSYVKMRGCSFATYNSRYEQEWETLAQRQDQFKIREYNRPMLTTWLISFNQLRAISQTAANVFLMWSFLDRLAMSYSLIISAAEEAKTDTPWPPWLKRLAKSSEHFSDEMLHLVTHSLVTIAGEEVYSMHDLLHQWSFALLVAEQSKEELGRFLSTVVMMVIRSGTWLTSAQRSFLEPHILAVSSRIETCFGRELVQESFKGLMAENMHDLANALDRLNMRENSELMYRRALEGYLMTVGKEHESYSRALSELGTLLWAERRIKEAEEMYTEALPGFEKHFGSDNQETVMLMLKTSQLRFRQRKFSLAAEVVSRAIEVQGKTADPMNRAESPFDAWLCVCYLQSGNADAAEPMVERILEECQRENGPDHSVTFEATRQMAEVYQMQGKLEAAAEAAQKALQGFERVNGREDTETLMCMGTLGIIYQQQGLFKDAEEMYQTALRGLEQRRHDHTIWVVYRLGNLLEECGRLDEAERLFERILVENLDKVGYEFDFTGGMSCVSLVGRDEAAEGLARVRRKKQAAHGADAVAGAAEADPS